MIRQVQKKLNEIQKNEEEAKAAVLWIIFIVFGGRHYSFVVGAAFHLQSRIIWMNVMNVLHQSE